MKQFLIPIFKKNFNEQEYKEINLFIFPFLYSKWEKTGLNSCKKSHFFLRLVLLIFPPFQSTTKKKDILLAIQSFFHIIKDKRKQKYDHKLIFLQQLLILKLFRENKKKTSYLLPSS